MAQEEARWNIRLPLEMDVRLRIAPAVQLRARTRDVSFEGMLVSATLPQVSRNTPIHVHFDGHTGPMQAAALVVRTGPEGTGLMFTGQTDAVADALALLMESELDRLLVAAKQSAMRAGR